MVPILLLHQSLQAVLFTCSLRNAFNGRRIFIFLVWASCGTIKIIRVNIFFEIDWICHIILGGE